MISLTSVTKKFKNKTAVESINLKAREGEIIGFVGPNGAGKTTTMRLILGYLQPTYGKITIDNLHPINDRTEVLKRIGYLPENNPLYVEMKVKEYLACIAKTKGNDDYLKTIANIDLKDELASKIEELSRGFKQRVGLAAALIGDPKILVLDEPTSGLDPIEQEKIRDLIKTIANPQNKGAKKKTVIFSTHILSEVEDVANRLIIINQGKIVFDGSKPEGRGEVERLFKELIK